MWDLKFISLYLTVEWKLPEVGGRRAGWGKIEQWVLGLVKSKVFWCASAQWDD
jgi:hypothetical protein